MRILLKKKSFLLLQDLLHELVLVVLSPARLHACLGILVEGLRVVRRVPPLLELISCPLLLEHKSRIELLITQPLRHLVVLHRLVQKLNEPPVVQDPVQVLPVLAYHHELEERIRIVREQVFPLTEIDLHRRVGLLHRDLFVGWCQCLEFLRRRHPLRQAHFVKPLCDLEHHQIFFPRYQR